MFLITAKLTSWLILKFYSIFSRVKEANLRLGGVVLVSREALEEIDREDLAQFEVHPYPYPSFFTAKQLSKSLVMLSTSKFR